MSNHTQNTTNMDTIITIGRDELDQMVSDMTAKLERNGFSILQMWTMTDDAGELIGCNFSVCSYGGFDIHEIADAFADIAGQFGVFIVDDYWLDLEIGHKTIVSIQCPLLDNVNVVN